MPQPTRRRTFLTGISSSLWLAFRSGTAEPAPPRLRLQLFVIPEALWQAKLKDQHRDAADLCDRLLHHSRQQPPEARLAVDQEITLKGDLSPLDWQRGGTRQFTTGWQVTGGTPEVRPQASAGRFVGTRASLTEIHFTDDHRLAFDLEFEHHTAPPGMRRINFANAAEGAERDRLSVEYPEFHKLEWRGGVSLGRAPQLLAQMLHAPVADLPARRHLLILSPGTP